jgi:hypothetical protein
MNDSSPRLIAPVIFGSSGMFYSTVKGAIIMTQLTIVLAIVFMASNPAMLIAHFPAMWLISIVWGAMAVKSYNKENLTAVLPDKVLLRVSVTIQNTLLPTPYDNR